MRAPKFIASFPVLALLLAAGTMPSCVGYNVYPPMEGERGFTNVNSDPCPQVMTQALRWVALRYPPNADAEWNQPSSDNVGANAFAINLPSGLNRRIAERIIKDVGNGAQPMLAGAEKLPTYHVARISVRGDDAYVDVVRPVLGLSTGDSAQPITQAITLRLRGGIHPWEVTSHREWSFNSLQPPALNYLEGETLPTGTPAPAKESDEWKTGSKPSTP